MAGEAERVTSAWVELLASASVGAGGISGESGSINASAITAAEKLYELVDFELAVTGTPAADGNIVELIKRPKGNNAGQVPTVAYAQITVEWFVLKAAANGSYYVYGVPLDDDLDTYYLINRDTGALTLSLNARTRTTRPAA